MNKYYEAIINTSGDAKALSRVQVLDNTGDIVTIYADKSGTRFTDTTGANVNYCEADATGMVEFYWTAASNQTLQVLDSTGELERSIADFANNFSVPEATANVDAVLGVTASDGDLGTFTGSTIPDSSAVKPALQALETAGEQTASDVAALASTAPGEGAALVAGIVRPVADRTELSALNTTAWQVADLKETGREGTFYWTSGDQSAAVAADVQKGVYVASGDDPTGASGAWVRQFDTLKLDYFGAVGDDFTDDHDAIEAAISFLDAIGGGELHGSTGKTYRITSQIDMTDFTNIRMVGNGATLFRFTAGTSANAITIINCTDIYISGWTISSSYDGFISGSTGSNPNILLGAALNSLNKNIHIFGNILTKANHASIVVGQTGINALITNGTFYNDGIWIYNNHISNSPNATFIYKGARNVVVANNIGENFSSSGIALDTCAATDLDTNSYTIENVIVCGNILKNVATVGVFAGRGIVLKGGIYRAVIEKNIVNGVNSLTNIPTYGILVTPDQHSVTPAAGENIKILGNTVRNVSCTVGTGAWSISVAKNYLDVMVDGNTFDTAIRGVIFSDLSEWRFTNNTLVNMATVGDPPFQTVYEGSASTYKKVIEGNSFIKGTGVTTNAINIVANTSNFHFGRNEFRGFTTKFSIAASVSYTADDYIVGTATIVVGSPVTVTGGAAAVSLGSATITGAVTTDLVQWSATAFTGYRECANNPAVTATNTVDFYTRACSDTVGATIPASTITLQVKRSVIA